MVWPSAFMRLWDTAIMQTANLLRTRFSRRPTGSVWSLGYVWPWRIPTTASARHAAGMMTVMVPDLLPASDDIRGLCVAVITDRHGVRQLLLDPDVHPRAQSMAGGLGLIHNAG